MSYASTCYLARAGRDVVVVEQLDRPGGGSRTEETVPGYRFDLHSAAHNIINLTDIPAELDLPGAGLDYQEMDPSRSPCTPTAGVCGSTAVSRPPSSPSPSSHPPRRRLPTVHGQGRPHRAHGAARRARRHIASGPAPQLASVVRAVRGGPLATARDVMSPYDSLLRRGAKT